MGDLALRELAELEEVVEVVGLSASDEFLGQPRHLHESNMPHRWMALDLFPTIDSRKRHIEDHCPTCCLWITANEGVSHHPANVVTNDIHALQFKGRHNLVEVLRHICGAKVAPRSSRLAHPAQIYSYNGKSLRQTRHDRVKLKPILWESMEKYHRGPLTAADIVNRNSIHLQDSRIESASELLNSGIRPSFANILAEAACSRGQDQNSSHLGQIVSHTLIAFCRIGPVTWAEVVPSIQ